MNAPLTGLRAITDKPDEPRVLVTRLNANSPVTIGPFTETEAESKAKALKAEYPTSEVVFSRIYGRVVDNPVKHIVEMFDAD